MEAGGKDDQGSLEEDEKTYEERINPQGISGHMELDLKTFVQTLRGGDTKKAMEWLERTKGRVDPDDGFERGYLLALGGMVAALESGRELLLVNRVVGGEYEQEQITELVKSARERLSRKFRPEDEKGFDTALVGVLQEFSGENV